MAFHSVVSPPLPRAEIRDVPGRGELFVRLVDGPDSALPVLLVHGWQATADLNFFPLFGPLAQRHRVIAPDLRGHGRSLYPEEPFTLEAAADDCAALLRDLGIERAIVVGYSLGCAVAQTLLGRHGELVAGMFLMAGELSPRRRPQLKVAVRLGGWLGTAQRMTSGRGVAHRLVDKAVKHHPAHERYRTWIVREIERGHVASLREAGRALGRFDGVGLARRHQDLPIAVGLTSRDRLVLPGRQRELATAWRAPVIEIDADHDAPLAQPEQFVAAMLQGIALVAERTERRGDRAIA